MTIIRVVFAMLFLGSASFGGVYLLAEDATQALQAATFPGSRAQGLLGGGYNLAELELLESTLYYVEEAYVEPQRIQYDKMYRAALQSIERRVPTCMFRREAGASMLHIQVGTFQTVAEVPEITSSSILRQQLRKIAAMVQAHVNVEDINMRDESSDPYAQIEYSMINGMLSTLDPHSILLPPVDSRQMDEDNKGEFGGLGITIVSREGRLTVEYPLKDTPAEREGLRPDDHIVRIDGETTINMSLEEAVRKLRGPVGAPVVIHIMRQGLTEPLRVPIVRARIKLNPVEGQLLDGGVGWISIKSFHANVEADLGAQLSLLRREAGGRLKGLVIDLRGNPGGYLNQAIAVSDRFLTDGVIVSTVDGQGREGTREVARSRNTEENYPIAVLLDSSSASASEIVAGALRNNERAIVIGERSFGKGSVQNLTPFFDQSKLKLTISKYLTPGGRSIQSVGIPADIEMLPVIVEGREADDEVGTDLALVYWRERVRREGDLDKHLDRAQIREEKPAYSFTYLRPKDMRRKSADIDLSNDEQIQFARDVLLSSASSKRPEMLATAHRVVRKYKQQSQAKITGAFEDLGIDWSDGPSQEDADLDVSVTFGGDAEMQAGSYEVVRISVTNRGQSTLYQLGALTTSENQILDDGEFFFGKLAPGDTRYFERRVWVLTGYPSEEAPVEIQFRDSENQALANHRVKVPVKGNKLPKFSWEVDVDDARFGNGDGILQVDERVLVNLKVTNVGEGASAEAFARVKNKSGSALDIVRGTVEPGFMVNDSGARCEPILPGLENGEVVGPVEKAPERIESKDPPTYDSECKRTLGVGETWSGHFELVAQKDIDAPLEFELSIGDAEAYDHASVMRQGFYGYFTDIQEMSFRVGTAFENIDLVIPPDVTVSQQPPSVVDVADTTVSGVVRDDKGIAHIMVFHGEDKVFFDGSGADSALRSVPFSSDIRLKEGLNTITVLATDVQGATDTQSVIVYRNSGVEIKDGDSLEKSE